MKEPIAIRTPTGIARPRALAFQDDIIVRTRGGTLIPFSHDTDTRRVDTRIKLRHNGLLNMVRENAFDFFSSGLHNDFSSFWLLRSARIKLDGTISSVTLIRSSNQGDYILTEQGQRLMVPSGFLPANFPAQTARAFYTLDATGIVIMWMPPVAWNEPQPNHLQYIIIGTSGMASTNVRNLIIPNHRAGTATLGSTEGAAALHIRGTGANAANGDSWYIRCSSRIAVPVITRIHTTDSFQQTASAIQPYHLAFDDDNPNADIKTSIAFRNLGNATANITRVRMNVNGALIQNTTAMIPGNRPILMVAGGALSFVLPGQGNNQVGLPNGSIAAPNHAGLLQDMTEVVFSSDEWWAIRLTNNRIRICTNPSTGESVTHDMPQTWQAGIVVGWNNPPPRPGTWNDVIANCTEFAVIRNQGGFMWNHNNPSGWPEQYGQYLIVGRNGLQVIDARYSQTMVWPGMDNSVWGGVPIMPPMAFAAGTQNVPVGDWGDMWAAPVPMGVREIAGPGSQGGYMGTIPNGMFSHSRPDNTWQPLRPAGPILGIAWPGDFDIDSQEGFDAGVEVIARFPKPARTMGPSPIAEWWRPIQ